MGVRLSKSLDQVNEWTTCRATEQVTDRKERWRRKIGNQFVDLLWSSGEGLEQAETEIPETKQRPLTEFYGGVSTSHAVEVKDKWRQDAASRRACTSRFRLRIKTICPTKDR